MTITLNTVTKVVLILCSLVLLISIFLEGLVLNTVQTGSMASIFLLAFSLKYNE